MLISADERTNKLIVTASSQNLDSIEQMIKELDTSEVAPTAHVAVAAAPLREDEVRAVLATQETLSEAPRRSGDGFAVPAFVDEG